MDPRISFARSADRVSIAWTAVGGVQGETESSNVLAPALVHMPGAPFSNFEAEWRIGASRRAYEALARHVRLIQYDARGTGRSQREVSDFSLEAMLSDLEAVVDGAGLDGGRLEQFALLGFYNSVPHAIAFAGRHPDRVTHLILFGGGLRGWSPMSGASTQALLSLIDQDWDTFAEAVAHAWLGWPGHVDGPLVAEWFRTASTPSIARATLQVASGIDVSPDAARVRCPALVLHRRDATVVSLETSEELADVLPKGQLLVLEGSSATLFYEETDVVIDEITRFLGVPGVAIGRQRRPGSAGTATVGRSTDGERANGLSPRDREVLRLIARGDTNGQIAAGLGLSINTVERHVANLYRKIDVRGRAEASAFAVRHGLD